MEQQQKTTESMPLNGLVSKLTCPHTRQNSLIKAGCPIITPTGCTAQFCASGRMIRPLEPRVGQNQSIESMKNEAEAFLREMFNEDLFSAEQFTQRLECVLEEIENGAVRALVWENKVQADGEAEQFKIDGTSSTGWVQTREELEWGVRVAWKNSRKCIMRAHFGELKLVDLRDVRSSRGMLDAVIEHLPAAYNDGKIVPTVFMFPRRTINQVGPMFWSQQLLSFAGYEMPGGKILGDPSRVQLTKDIISLGWSPPEPRSRWDVLPLVAMAEGDEPAFATLPAQFTKLIPIRHATYQAFSDLDLNWIRFPALSRLGFDIGGVQYTAAPFIGWFMDAELGVRNLADTFRYNVLPDVARAIGFKGEDLNDLPDHEKLVWLSRAQAELNYAVHSSFHKAGVTCSSTLAASQSWCTFDDQHFKEKGYRLNADPYWIAPPQGSIVPIWHRGGAPNYQPKPLIARHRFDPVKVWRRRNGLPTKEISEDSSDHTSKSTEATSEQTESRVHVLFCGTGGTASKLAEKLVRCLREKPAYVVGTFGPLNSLNPSIVDGSDTLLLVVATAGKGEVPSNGLRFMKKMSDAELTLRSARYAIFGLGDSSYRDSFNGGSKLVDGVLRKIGWQSLLSPSLLEGDVAVEDPPLASFQKWLARIEKVLDGEDGTESMEEGEESAGSIYTQHYNMLRSFSEATMYFDEEKHKPGALLRVSLEIPEPEFQDMGHIRLVPRNSPRMVKKVVNLLGIKDQMTFVSLLDSNGGRPLPQRAVLGERPKIVSISNFLTDFADLCSPFVSLDWVENPTVIDNTSVIQALKSLSRVQRQFDTPELLRKVLFSMPILQVRSYSAASSSLDPTIISPNKSIVDILVHVFADGRFSGRCLTDLGNHGKILYKLAPNKACLPLLNPTNKPIVAVACGTCIGPMRSLIYRRIRLLERNDIKPVPDQKISLFLGFKTEPGNKLLIKMVDEATKASKHGILDLLYLVPSNKAKRRVQDYFEDCADILRRRLIEEGGYLYVCGNENMVREVTAKIRDVLCVEAWDKMEDRVIQEAF